MSKENNKFRFSDEERARTIIIPRPITPDENRELVVKWRVTPRLARSGKSTIIVCPTVEDARSIIEEIKEHHPDAELSRDKVEYSVVFPVIDPAHARDNATLIPNTINTNVWDSGEKTLIFASFKNITHVINTLNNPPPHENLSQPFLSKNTRDDLNSHRLIFLHSIPKTNEEVINYDNDIRTHVGEIATKGFNVGSLLNKGCTFVLFESLEDITRIKESTVDGRLNGNIEPYRFLTMKEMEEEMKGKKKSTNDNISDSSSSSSNNLITSASQITISPQNYKNGTSFIINIPQLGQPSTSTALTTTRTSDEINTRAINPLMAQLQNSIMGAINSINSEISKKNEALIEMSDSINRVEDTVKREADTTRKHLRDDNIQLREEVKSLKITLDSQITMLATLADNIKNYHNHNIATAQGVSSPYNSDSNDKGPGSRTRSKQTTQVTQV